MQRFEIPPYGDMALPRDNGEWVKYIDAAAEMDTLLKQRDELRAALETIANPKRGTPAEHWDVGQIGDFARSALSSPTTGEVK